MTIRERIEAKAGRPLERVLEDYARAGRTQSELAADHGESPNTLRGYMRRHGLSGRVSYTQVLRYARISEDSPGVVCTIRGVRRWRPLGEIAEEIGISCSTLRARWRRGQRSEQELLGERGRGRREAYFEVGWSEQEWRQALEAADSIIRQSRRPPEVAVKAAADKLRIPLGALRAAQRGEWYRIA